MLMLSESFDNSAYIAPRNDEVSDASSSQTRIIEDSFAQGSGDDRQSIGKRLERV